MSATLLATLASLAAAQSAPTPPPERAMLDAYRAACDAVTDWSRLSAAPAAQGWEAIDEASNPQLAQINRTGREAVGSEGRMAGASYRRTVAGRTLYLVTSRWEGEGGVWGNGCRLYDFSATAPIAPAALTAWMGRAPTGTQAFGAIGSRMLWEPGWRDGLTLSVNHVPAGSSFRQQYGLSGNVLVAQAIGGF